MKRIAEWFTTQRRQAIQVFAGSIAPFAILFGFGTDGFWEQALIITGAVLQAASSLLSLVNVRAGDWGTGWAVIRGAVYSFAIVVSPSLSLLGLYNADTNATILVAVSLGLAALSNLTAIFSAKATTPEGE